jgi:hypothetical protein
MRGARHPSGGKGEVAKDHVAWIEQRALPEVPLAALLPGLALRRDQRQHRLVLRRRDRQNALPAKTGSARLLLSLTRRRQRRRRRLVLRRRRSRLQSRRLARSSPPTTSANKSSRRGRSPMDEFTSGLRGICTHSAGRDERSALWICVDELPFCPNFRPANDLL